MKIHITPEIIIGSLLILWGISMIIKVITGIDIPVLKPFIALILIYLGITLLVKPPFVCTFKKSFRYTSHKDKDSKTEEHIFTVGDDETKE